MHFLVPILVSTGTLFIYHKTDITCKQLIKQETIEFCRSKSRRIKRLKKTGQLGMIMRPSYTASLSQDYRATKMHKT